LPVRLIRTAILAVGTSLGAGNFAGSLRTSTAQVLESPAQRGGSVFLTPVLTQKGQIIC
jgi:hypothetical protein